MIVLKDVEDQEVEIGVATETGTEKIFSVSCVVEGAINRLTVLAEMVVQVDEVEAEEEIIATQGA